MKRVRNPSRLEEQMEGLGNVMVIALE